MDVIESHPIKGTGAVAEILRNMDWRGNSLGPISGWPVSLLLNLNMILAAPLPMQILWGPEMIALYNDALAASLPGKHPHILGMPARRAYEEAWPVIGQQLEDVLYRGSAVSLRGVFVPLFRGEALEGTYWDYTYTPLFEEDGTIAGILDVAQDVTEISRAALEKKFTEEQLSLAMDAAGLGIWWYNSETDVVISDRRMQQIFGSPESHGSVKFWLDCIHPDDAVRVNQNFWAALEGRNSYELEYRIVRSDGVRWVRSRGRVDPQPNGHRKMFAIIEDITERKLVEETLQRSQAALIQTEKLAAVGRLAASISHEINNPLEAVTNLIYLIRESGISAEVREYAQTAERELRRVSIITNQTLRFHKQSTNPVAVYCYDLIGETLSVFQGRLVNSRIEVEKRKRAQRPVHCLDGEIRQVLGNLVGNAIDAMPFGGRLLIRSREATNWRTGERGIVLTVADTGTGMSASVQKRIFEPFYSTKGIGGTGLGLWISCEIVTRHKGSLRTRSSQQEECSGTVFTLFLPFQSSAF